jgi:hypothetical protein
MSKGFEEGNYLLKLIPQDRRINKLKLSPVKPFLKVPRRIEILGYLLPNEGEEKKESRHGLLFWFVQGGKW